MFLQHCRHLRYFCGFIKVPDASKIIRSKLDFLTDLNDLFLRLVDLTEAICQAIDSVKADMSIFDSSGIEAYVTENNPKYAKRIIRQLKAYAKVVHFDDDYDPYKAAYGSISSHSAANPDIKQLYVDGHFCYAYKLGIVTNGLEIVRHIGFYNKDFFDNHPKIVLKKYNSPDEDKSVHDARLLIPTLKVFLLLIPLSIPKLFLAMLLLILSVSTVIFFPAIPLVRTTLVMASTFKSLYPIKHPRRFGKHRLLYKQ